MWWGPSPFRSQQIGTTVFGPLPRFRASVEGYPHQARRCSGVVNTWTWQIACIRKGLWIAQTTNKKLNRGLGPGGLQNTSVRTTLLTGASRVVTSRKALKMISPGFREVVVPNFLKSPYSIRERIEKLSPFREIFSSKVVGAISI